MNEVKRFRVMYCFGREIVLKKKYNILNPLKTTIAMNVFLNTGTTFTIYTRKKALKKMMSSLTESKERILVQTSHQMGKFSSLGWNTSRALLLLTIALAYLNFTITFSKDVRRSLHNLSIDFKSLQDSVKF